MAKTKPDMIEKFFKILGGLFILGCVVMCAGFCVEVYYRDYRYMPAGRAQRKIAEHVDFKLPSSIKPQKARARNNLFGYEIIIRFRFDWNELGGFMETADFLLGDNTHMKSWRHKENQLSIINKYFSDKSLGYNSKSAIPVFWGRKYTSKYMMTILGVWDGKPEKAIDTYMEVNFQGANDPQDEHINYLYLNYAFDCWFPKIPRNEILTEVKELTGVDLKGKYHYRVNRVCVFRGHRACALTFDCNTQDIDHIVGEFGFHNKPNTHTSKPDLYEMLPVFNDIFGRPRTSKLYEVRVSLYAALKNKRHETTMIVERLSDNQCRVNLLVENRKHKTSFVDSWAVLKDFRKKPATRPATIQNKGQTAHD